MPNATHQRNACAISLHAEHKVFEMFKSSGLLLSDAILVRTASICIVLVLRPLNAMQCNAIQCNPCPYPLLSLQAVNKYKAKWDAKLEALVEKELKPLSEAYRPEEVLSKKLEDLRAEFVGDAVVGAPKDVPKKVCGVVASNAQINACSNAKMPNSKFPNAQNAQCPNVQMVICSNAQCQMLPR